MATSLMSMTGYGEAQATLDEVTLRVHCRSVNQKGLKLRVVLPAGLEAWEAKVRRAVKERVHRGRVEIRVSLEKAGKGGGPLAIDEERFGEVVTRLKRLCEDHRLEPPTLTGLHPFRDHFTMGEEQLGRTITAQEGLALVQRALDAMMEQRRREGEALRSDLLTYQAQINNALDDVETVWPRERQRRVSRARRRLEETLDAFEVDEVDDDRVAQELAYIADRGDISEELQRAMAHAKQLRVVIEDEDGARGKKIDFYLQELIRETNTMGSKCQTAQLRDRVIEMKSIVEKMREQAANVE